MPNLQVEKSSRHKLLQIERQELPSESGSESDMRCPAVWQYHFGVD